ncbi:RICIN domain-containing protein [Catenuloplanes sp. NPDC051500]|uniref:RICIN domain-containing protein n=1 Tax=Catenuloplanes sp. NPDC051500 TaxID=3363959 RepID=UPI0037A6B4C2
MIGAGCDVSFVPAFTGEATLQGITLFRRLAAAIFAIAAVSALTLVAPSSASAAPSTFRISNRGTGACLSSNGTDIYTVYPCTNIAYHDWYWVTYVQTGYTALINNGVGSGKCLSANYNDDVYPTACNGTTVYHSWSWTNFGELMNNGTGRCLSANFNDDVYTAQCVGSSVIYHQWRTDL